MNIKEIKKLLQQALLHDGAMQYELYQHELEEQLDEMKASMAADKDDYIFTVTVNNGDVAMLLIEKSGDIHINEAARERLKTLWPAAYKSNMKKFIPLLARQLSAGELPLNGVKTAV
jgi:frataxin-like iron-binding protein CyaY